MLMRHEKLDKNMRYRMSRKGAFGETLASGGIHCSIRNGTKRTEGAEEAEEAED